MTGDPILRIFSYLPNPRVWKAQIAGELCNVEIEVVCDEPSKLARMLLRVSALSAVWATRIAPEIVGG